MEKRAGHCKFQKEKSKIENTINKKLYKNIEIYFVLYYSNSAIYCVLHLSIAIFESSNDRHE